MPFIHGIVLNLRGLWVGVSTPRLLFWGLVRLLMVVLLTVVSAGLILAYHEQILNMVWARPETRWVLWLWMVVSWLLSFLLVGIAAVVSYLASQVLFSVVVMDLMSRITERDLTGRVEGPGEMTFFRLFLYLVRQEIPRTVLPVLISLALMLAGWLTPFGPLTTVFSAGAAALFLAWDNTDLVPARRLVPFRDRLALLRKTILFHLGFGVLFLIPVLNILLLSFAPVGATLYHLEGGQGAGKGRKNKASALRPATPSCETGNANALELRVPADIAPS
jgi:CysZ protein